MKRAHALVLAALLVGCHLVIPHAPQGSSVDSRSEGIAPRLDAPRSEARLGDGSRDDGSRGDGVSTCDPACEGCCDAQQQCVPIANQSPGRCGKGGGACQICPAATLCLPAAECTDGQCTMMPTLPNAPCDLDKDPCTEDRCDPSGTCQPGPNTCSCQTCISNGNCHPTGDEWFACGTGGVSCAICDDGNPCTTEGCTKNGTCKLPGTAPPGTACGTPFSPGICLGSSCCKGCIASGSCENGDHSLACGKGGGDCTMCFGSETCVNGKCTP